MYPGIESEWMPEDVQTEIRLPASVCMAGCFIARSAPAAASARTNANTHR